MTNQAGDMKEERMPDRSEGCFEEAVEALAQWRGWPPALLERWQNGTELRDALQHVLVARGLKLVEEQGDPQTRITEALKTLREAGKELLKKPTDEQTEHALEVARERGWLTDDGFVWDRQSGHHPEGEPSEAVLTRDESEAVMWTLEGVQPGTKMDAVTFSAALRTAQDKLRVVAAIDHPQDREAK